MPQQYKGVLELKEKSTTRRSFGSLLLLHTFQSSLNMEVVGRKEIRANEEENNVSARLRIDWRMRLSLPFKPVEDVGAVRTEINSVWQRHVGSWSTQDSAALSPE
jgi:hypothetical protein